MRLFEYAIECKRINGSYKLAVLSDLHGSDPFACIELLKKSLPDFILAPGDIFELVDGSREKMNKMNESGFLLLSEAAKLAPTFYSMGNHEIGGTHSWAKPFGFRGKRKAVWSKGNLKRLEESGAQLLDDSYVLCGEFAIGGLSSGILERDGKPNLSFLEDFASLDVPKILLCHHPEYYEKYLLRLDVDLIVSGHAHGGQWRFLGKGVFSPGQGIFPKYTSGIYDGRLAVSRGMVKGRVIPRIFNPAEIMLIKVN